MPNGPRHHAAKIGGSLAVLGIDMVSFSQLHEEDQLQAIALLLRWVKQGLAHQDIKEPDYRWSGAGDGGYLTFGPRSSAKAIDVAVDIAQKAREPEWSPRSGEPLQLRMALHAGTVQEAEELGKGTNIWGMGINTAARILTVAVGSQLLMSKQYHDTYMANRRSGFEIGTPYRRTVKHGVSVEAMVSSSITPGRTHYGGRLSGGSGNGRCASTPISWRIPWRRTSRRPR